MVEGVGRYFVVIVDELKLVPRLGGSGQVVPVETYSSRMELMATTRYQCDILRVTGVVEHGMFLEKVPEFIVVNAFGTDEVIIAADIEVAAEDVTTPTVAVVPMTGASSPSTPSSNTHTASSPSITNSPESYEGSVRFRSIADIYANTEEVVGIDKEEGEVMVVISEEPTCYQEAATEAC
ncbi:hypothetical protein ZIOFF_048546 [Zingiber officinale]|uniref:Uncharacterized protein n=1 Tax=Zingiber officinale TaxID=94328 RepID=A0A8J5FTH4_ZINOF|nr:hypothetical protein ZIOFF_048546 [Zingiber officinale]